MGEVHRHAARLRVPAGLGPAVGWDGAPEWATFTDGLTTCRAHDTRELSPAVAQAFQCSTSTARASRASSSRRGAGSPRRSPASRTSPATTSSTSRTPASPSDRTRACCSGTSTRGRSRRSAPAERPRARHAHRVLRAERPLVGRRDRRAPAARLHRRRAHRLRPAPLQRVDQRRPGPDLDRARLRQRRARPPRCTASRCGRASGAGSASRPTRARGWSATCAQEDARRLGGAWWVWKQACGDPHVVGYPGASGSLNPTECPSGRPLGLVTGYTDLLRRAYPRYAPGRITALRATGHRAASLRGRAGDGACRIEVWVPRPPSPTSRATSVTDLRVERAARRLARDRLRPRRLRAERPPGRGRPRGHPAGARAARSAASSSTSAAARASVRTRGVRPRAVRRRGRARDPRPPRLPRRAASSSSPAARRPHRPARLPDLPSLADDGQRPRVHGELDVAEVPDPVAVELERDLAAVDRPRADRRRRR